MIIELGGAYLKLLHLSIKGLLHISKRYTAIFDTISYLFLPSASIKALIRTFKIGFLQSSNKTINYMELKFCFFKKGSCNIFPLYVKVISIYNKSTRYKRK